ncbi:MAG: hypothetical protein AAGJ52_05125 [Pseudomonadota bacterium]
MATDPVGPPPPCDFPDLMTVSPVLILPGATNPDPSDDPIPGGRWELIAVFLTPSLPVAISGEARGILELNASSDLTGLSNNAFNVQGEANPGATLFDESLNFAGPYAAAMGALGVTDECSNPPVASSIAYRVDTSGPEPALTLWNSLDAEAGPITITIDAELLYLLVEPQPGDPVFEDRFEGADR